MKEEPLLQTHTRVEPLDVDDDVTSRLLKYPIRSTGYDTAGRVRGEKRKEHEKTVSANKARDEELRKKRMAAHMARCPGCFVCDLIKGKGKG